MVSVDTELGAFTDDGPWVVRRDELVWLAGLDRTRADLVARLPELTRRRLIPPAPGWASPCDTSAARSRLWYAKERRRGGTEKIAGISRRLRIAAEHLGPTYIKLGQIVASGDGIFPPELVAEFKWCRDQVPPEPWPVDRRSDLTEELGRSPRRCSPPSTIEPLAAASIAQVHRARLLDGTEVVIKVQRPR